MKQMNEYLSDAGTRSSSGDVDSLSAERKGWMPIESAPKDRLIWVYAHREQMTAQWIPTYGGYWYSRGEEIEPSHWMPLPEAP